MSGETGVDLLPPASATPMVVEIAKIRPSKVALRGVNKQNPAYQELVDSIRKRGVLLPILLRELRDPETGETIYGLVDGLQRYTASQDCGRPTINANVISDMSDAEVLENQIVTNAIRVETKPGEFTKQLVRIFQANPLLTLADMAAKLNRSPGWIQDRLGLANLPDDVLKLVDEDKIPLSNAYALAKLPEDEISNFIQNAMTMSPAEFAPTAGNRAKEIREAKRQGRKPGETTFTPVKHFQKMPDVETEIAGRDAGRVLITEVLGVEPTQAHLDIWALALSWVLRQDPKSVEAAKQKFEAKQAALKAEREKRKAEREAAKEKAATETAASIG